MKTYTIGSSDVEASALCYGTDLIGSRIEKDRAFRLFDIYRDHGGNLLDTANFYSSWFDGFDGGESETVIGEWMKERGNRDDIVISSKLGFDYPSSDGGLSADEIERECEKSLNRLQTDYIDIYYSHRDDWNTPIEETMEAFHGLVESGKVRTIGASNLDIWRIAESNKVAEINGWTPYQVVEQRYTYLRPRHGADFGPQIFITKDMKGFTKHHDMSLIGYSVLLQGAYTREDREIPAQFAGPEADERLQALRMVANQVNATANQVVIAWMLHSDPVILPLFGGSKPEHLQENLGALDVKLSDQQMTILNTAGNPNLEKAWLQPE